MGGGEKLQSAGICKAVQFKCRGVNIVAIFHILAIGGSQMVLGIDWLQNLDEVSFNFNEQKLKITQEGKVWSLKGVHSHDMEVVFAPLMDKTMHQMAKGWVIQVCNKEGNSTEGLEKMSDLQLRNLCKEFVSLLGDTRITPKKVP